jgi:hypothetical protein
LTTQVFNYTLNTTERLLNNRAPSNQNNVIANLKTGMEQADGLSTETPHPIARDRIA